MKKKLIIINFLNFYEHDKKKLDLFYLNKKFDLELHEFYKIQSNVNFKKKLFNNKKFKLKSFRSVREWLFLMDKYFKKGIFNQNNISAIFISQFFFKLNFLKIFIFFKKRKLKIASFWNPGILIFKKNKKITIYEKLKKLIFNSQLKFFLFFVIIVPLLNKIRLKKSLFYDYLFVAGKEYEKLFFKDRSNENTK